MRTAERRPKRPLGAPAPVSRAADLGPGGLLALQRGAGNAAVARMLAREPAAQAQEEVRVVSVMPTFPEPGVKYVLGQPEKRYDFEVTIDTRPMRFHGLDPAEVVRRLRMVWRMAHDM